MVFQSVLLQPASTSSSTLRVHNKPTRVLGRTVKSQGATRTSWHPVKAQMMPRRCKRWRPSAPQHSSADEAWCRRHHHTKHENGKSICRHVADVLYFFENSAKQIIKKYQNAHENACRLTGGRQRFDYFIVACSNKSQSNRTIF